MATTTTTLPLRAAAAQLGLSVDTLRKRLQRGLTPGRKVDGAWVVEVLDSPGPVPDNQDGPGHVQDTSPPPQMPILAQRAEEMARYTAALLEPLHARLEAQATQIGRLENEVEHLRAQLAAATNGQAQTQSGAAPWPERRRWWTRLIWG
jgi:hypothetical protein